MISIIKQITSALLFLSLSCQSTPVNSKVPCDFIAGISGSNDLVCGKLKVPENHDDPQGRSIEIAYVVIPSNNPESKAYPMIYLAGGPGSSSLDAYRIERWLRSPIGEERDIILIDQRGIGHSSALPNMNEELYEVMRGDVNEEEEKELIRKLLSDYHQKCKEQDIQLENFNSFQNARDIGALMKHLGYEKYNLYGVSYGTRLARIVQEMYPELLNSVILNSPNPLKGDFLIDRLHSYSLALERVFAYCESDPNCKDNYPNLKEEYLQTIQSLEQEPLKLNIEGRAFYFNAQDGIFFIRRALYGNDSRATIPRLIKEYQNGGGPIVQNLIEYEFTPDYNFSMWLTVERHEMFDPTNTKEVVAETYEKLLLLPSELGLFTGIYLSMDELHDSTLSEAEKKFNQSSVPTLITVNQFDPVTPPENGAIMMESLSKGQLYILDEGGHGGGNMDCRYRVMNAFMDAPDSELDVSCLHLYK